MARLTSRGRTAEKAYACLLWLFPSSYNTRYNTEMRRAFRDLYNDSPRHAASFWTPLITDALSSAVREHALAIRHEGIKPYFANSADGPTLAWGVGLMVPSGVFFLLALLGLLHAAQLSHLPGNIPVLPILIAFLPLVAVAINVIALARAIVRSKQPFLRWNFIRRYAWTLAIIAAALGWLVLLFGHDTIGCAVNYLPALDWHGFQHCSARH
jgi:hypothetical protein